MTKMPMASPVPSRGQDFVLLRTPTLHPSQEGWMPIGAALGEVEGQKQEMKMCPRKDLNLSVHSSFIHCSPKLKTAQMAISRGRMNKLACPYSRILLSNRKQRTHVCDRMRDAYKTLV